MTFASLQLTMRSLGWNATCEHFRNCPWLCIGRNALSVADWEELELTFDKSSISEKGGITQATLRRSNTDVTTSLTVNVGSSDTTELTAPTSVTIPAGQASAVFDLTAVDDDLLDGLNQ